MPVGRFRSDPRDLDEDERAVAARQYPEGLFVLGSLLGLSVPFVLREFAPSAPALLQSPLAPILGLMVCGVGGYLLGDVYRRYAIDRRRSRAPEDSDEPAGGG